MKRTVSTWVAVAAAIMLTSQAACSGDRTGDANLRVGVTTLSATVVASVTVSVTGPGMTEIDTTLVQVGGTWQGTLGGIPAGDDRVFAANAYDGSGNLQYQGQSGDVTIVADETAFVALELQPVNPPPGFNNHAPVISSVYASTTTVAPAGEVSLSVTASDADGDPITYAWTDTAGTFDAPSNPNTDWFAPSTDGTYPLTITVTDPYGAMDGATVSIVVSESASQGDAQVTVSFNDDPIVQDLVLTPGRLMVGVPSTAVATANDPDGDALTYAWSDDCGGTWTGTGATASITISDPTLTSCTIRVDVSDGNGGTNFGALVVPAGMVTVQSPPVIDTTFQSVTAVDSAQSVVLRITANDPQNGVLGFQWSASQGTLYGGWNPPPGESDVTWQAPSCFSDPATVTVAITDSAGLTTTATFTIAATEATSCTPPGIVSWLPCDDTPDDLIRGSALVVPQQIPGGNGPPEYAVGVRNDGCWFPYQSGWDLSEAGLPTGNADRTLELWMRIDAPVPEGESFFAGYGAFGTFTGSFALGAIDTDPFWSQWGAGTSAPASVVAGTWHHLAVTHASATGLNTFYVDGVAVTTDGSPVDTGAGDELLGYHDPYRYLIGMVDEVRVFDRALTPGEVARIANMLGY